MRIIHLFLLLAAASLSAPLLHADGATEPPAPVRTVAPQYPQEMRRDGVSGIVMVNCLIDEKGDVQDPKVEKSSNNAFVQPAMDAVKRWKFKPAKREGAPVSIRVTIPIKFSCED